MPKISVVLPVYNSEKYLAEAIKSILAQDFTDFELIIIDDGSTDASLNAAKSFSDKRIKIFKEDKIGITKALNLGIQRSSGEYIARMDADDVSASDRFSEQVSFMDSHPEVGLTGAWYYYIGAKGEIIEAQTPPTTSREIKKGFFYYAPIIHSIAMIRRQALLEVGLYNEHYIYAQDRDLFLRISAKWDLAVIPKYLFSFRVSSDSITRSKELLQKKFAIEAIESAVKAGLYPKYYIFPLFLRKMLLHLPTPCIRWKNRIMMQLGFRH